MAEDTASIPPAEGVPATQPDVTIEDVTEPTADLPTKDDLSKQLEVLSQGPASSDREAQKSDVAYRLSTKLYKE